jgi:5-(carboxyamino)imidazole ribonucleotide synthase
VINGMAAVMRIPGVCLHIYGKAVTKPHRKMGHITVLDRDIGEAKRKAEQVRGLIQITGEQHP